jgi:hypothetical protein
LPLLAGSDGNANASFQNVYIDANDTLPSGESASFMPMGSNGSPNLVYVIQDGGKAGEGLTVAATATLTVDSGVNVLIAGASILTVNGALDVTAPASFQVSEGSFYVAAGSIVINGTMSATNTDFTNSGNGNGTNIEIASGGSMRPRSVRAFAKPCRHAEQTISSLLRAPGVSHTQGYKPERLSGRPSPLASTTPLDQPLELW